MTRSDYKQLLIESATDGTFPSITDSNGDGGPSCRYRKNYTPSCKQKCSIGVLIPDELYNENLENMPIARVVEKCNIQVENVTIYDFRDIQVIHDRYATDGWDSEKFINEINSLKCLKENQNG